MVATRSSAWQSWHDPPQKTEVCLSLSAGPGKALEASCASLPSPPLAGKARRVTDAHDWRGFPRTREDIAHPYWLLTNPYSVFIRRLIRRPLDPSPLSLSLSLSFSLSVLYLLLSLSNLVGVEARCNSPFRTPSQESFQCISPPAFTFPRIFLSKYFFNKHAYHSPEYS